MICVAGHLRGLQSCDVFAKCFAIESIPIDACPLPQGRPQPTPYKARPGVDCSMRRDGIGLARRTVAREDPQ